MTSHSPDSWPKITLFGDSITRLSADPDNGCWSSYLTHRLASFYQVDVRGFNGYTTETANEYLRKLFTPQYLKNVEIFIIFFGHNDSWQIPEGGTFPSVSATNYEKNLNSIIEYLTNEGGLKKENVIIITPGWYDGPTAMKHLQKEESTKGHLGKTLEHSKQYAEASIRVANKQNVSFVDWWKKTLEYEPLAELFYDGLHLSRIGARTLYDLVLPEIEKKVLLLNGKQIDELNMLPTMDEIIAKLAQDKKD